MKDLSIPNLDHWNSPERVGIFPTVLMGLGSVCWFLDTDIAVTTNCFSYYLKGQGRDKSQTNIEK